MTEYLGYPIDGSDPTGDPDDTGNGNYNFSTGYKTPANASFMCPGSGLMAITSLKVYVKGTAGSVRCAIFNVNKTFVVQHSTKVAVGANYAWIGADTFTDQAGNPVSQPTLVAGNFYHLEVSIENNAVYLKYKLLTQSIKGDTNKTYYDIGFPATLTDGTFYNACYAIRATLEQLADPANKIIGEDYLWQ